MKDDDAEVLFALGMSMEHDIHHQAQALRTWWPNIQEWYRRSRTPKELMLVGPGWHQVDEVNGAPYWFGERMIVHVTEPTSEPCDSANNEGTSLINTECPACNNQPIPFDHNTLVDCGTCNEPNNEETK